MWLQLGAIALGAVTLASIHTYLERKTGSKTASGSAQENAKQLPGGTGAAGGKTVFSAQIWKQAENLARKIKK